MAIRVKRQAQQNAVSSNSRGRLRGREILVRPAPGAIVELRDQAFNSTHVQGFFAPKFNTVPAELASRSRAPRAPQRVEVGVRVRVRVRVRFRVRVRVRARGLGLGLGSDLGLG